MFLVRKEKALNYKNSNSNYHRDKINSDKNSTNGNDPFEKNRPEPHENDYLKKEDIEDPFKY
ncbi:hypothetical protein BU664_11080 [Staphylococcus chromogenes]|nr:hypothetical protein BU664_11080 [Staphylococcus chromogenes]